jgi:hypothetical protein
MHIKYLTVRAYKMQPELEPLSRASKLRELLIFGREEGHHPAITMATRPGPLTEWPWQWMGSFKV